MSYSGAQKAGEARQELGKALEALQQDPNIPPDVMAVAQNIAQAVGALFEAERASSEPDGKSCARSALGSLSQTLALLQDVRQHGGIETATEVLARAMGLLYPLTTQPSRPPPSVGGEAAPGRMPAPGRVPSEAAAFAERSASAQPAGQLESADQPRFAGAAPEAAAPAPEAPRSIRQPASARAPASGPAAAKPQGPQGGARSRVEANIGATTESNFYVGFSGEIGEGGVFLSTYEVLAAGTGVELLVTLPGGFEFETHGWVRFVRDPMDFAADSEPGMGIQFQNLPAAGRDLALRFIRKRPPIFYDE
ncbi:MAG: hypothetical protein OEY14_17830 [Myxococcales bacterium]|nr:hypothetical protein [Myxococcales bacterium]